MTRRWTGYVGVVAVVLLSAAPGAARAQKASAEDQIRIRVEGKLFDQGLVNVHVDVRQRTVTLSGTVESLWLKEQAIRQVRKLRDVQEVVSALTIPRGESDADMARDIASDVSVSSYFSIFDDVSVTVAEGDAVLTGSVTAAIKSVEFATQAAKVPGIQHIDNRIEILPVSMMDDDIRDGVAMAIYRHPMFAPYTLPRVGPIHIIVNTGRVRLVGVVGSEGERYVAEMLARGVFGVMDVENQLRFAENSVPPRRIPRLRGGDGPGRGVSSGETPAAHGLPQ